MKVLDDRIADCPPVVAACLNERVELAPGVRKRFGDCTMEEVAGCVEASHEGMLNWQEIAALLQRALDTNITVSSELLERLSGAETGPQLIAVRGELRRLVGGHR